VQRITKSQFKGSKTNILSIHH